MTARVSLGKCNRTSARSPPGNMKYGCQPMPIGSNLGPTFFAVTVISNASWLRVVCTSTSVSESQWPSKFPACNMALTAES
jgi:hypothetical protein